MKVLFLSSWYPTKQNPNFGIFVKEHACAIHKAGNEIVVLALVIGRNNKLYSQNINDGVDEHGVRTLRIEINTRFKDIVYHLLPLQYLIVKRVFNHIVLPDFEPDIIHSNVVFPAGVIGNYLSNSIKKPHVITEHWSRLAGFIKKPILGKLAVNAYRNSAFILPVSDFLKASIQKIQPHLTDSKFKIVGNVIDSETFFYKEKTQNSDTVNFCAIASWVNKKVPDKVPEIFIRALALLQKDLKQKIVLTMIGGGDKVDALSAMCKSEGIHAVFTGFQDKKAIAGHLQSSDFFIHASTTETFGVVIAEALLTGTPVICSNVGALPELINSGNGILVNNTVREWLDGLKRAMNTDFHPAEIAKNTNEHFSYKTIGDKITDVYASVSAPANPLMKQM